eukprot:5096596-Prymnesium_polylepis.1
MSWAAGASCAHAGLDRLCAVSVGGRLVPRRELLLRGAAAARLGQEGLLPRRDQIVERHAGDRATRLAAIRPERRLVEAVDPTRRRRVGALVATTVEAAGGRVRLHRVTKDLGVALARDNLVDGGHAPRAVGCAWTTE